MIKINKMQNAEVGMKHFRKEDMTKIETDLSTLNERYATLLFKLHDLARGLKEEKAKEYLFHGVGRRIRILQRCTENIFTIYPIFPEEREAPLLRDELDDVMINLHAFLVNIFGILDNLAWVLLYEMKLAESMANKDVGLFMNKTQEGFSAEFRNYINSDRMKIWHTDYLKNYRDALSHRIAPYVPPKQLSSEAQKQLERIEQDLIVAREKRDVAAMERLHEEEDKVGEACPFFRHSLYGPITKNQIRRIGLEWKDVSKKLVENGWAKTENLEVVCLIADLNQAREGMQNVFGADFQKLLPIFEEAYGAVALHVQVITDFKTVEEIVENFCEMFKE